MDPPSQDLTLYRSGEAANYAQDPQQNVEQLIIYKEYLRRRRALLEEQEKQADISIGWYLSGSQQQQVPQGAFPSTSITVPPSFGSSSSTQNMITSANVISNLTRITEIENMPFQSTSYLPMASDPRVYQPMVSLHSPSHHTAIAPSSHSSQALSFSYAAPQANSLSEPQRPNFVHDNTATMQHVPAVSSRVHSSVDGAKSSSDALHSVQLNDEAGSRPSQEKAKATIIQPTNMTIESSSLSTQILPTNSVSSSLDIKKASSESGVASDRTPAEIPGQTGLNDLSQELLVLEQLLDDHERWSEDASVRIIQSVLSAPTEVESTRSEAMVNVNLNSFDSITTPLTQPTTVPTTVSSRPNLPGSSSLQRPNSNATGHLDAARPVFETITPASADHNTLAESILRALRPPSSKRRRRNQDIDRLEETPLARGVMGPIPSAGHIANTSSASLSPEELRKLTSNPTALSVVNGQAQYPQRHPHNNSYGDTISLQSHYQMPQHRPTQKVQSVPSITQLSQISGNHVQKPHTVFHNNGYGDTTFSPQSYYQMPQHKPMQKAQPVQLPVTSQVSGIHVQQLPPVPSTKLSEKASEEVKESGSRREPLFLPSSPSPTPISPLLVSPSKKIGLPRAIPVVDLGSSPSTSKSTAKAQLPSVPEFTSVTNKVESLFGQPTGILASATSSIPEKHETSSLSQTPPVNAKPTKNDVRSASWKKPRKSIRPSGAIVYVLIPPFPSRRAKLPKGKAREVISRSSLEEKHLHDDDKVVSDFFQRLIRRPCMWKNCHAILDSGEKLLKHVKYVHCTTQARDQVYKCKWAKCPSDGNYLDSEKLLRHLHWHAKARIYCAYKDCDFQTKLPTQLAEHLLRVHREGDMRSYALPINLQPPRLPPLVDVLPSYLSVPLPISARSIPSDRHQKIAPGFLRAIISDIKATAVVSSRLRAIDVLQLEDLDLDVDDDCRFAWSETPSKLFFESLVQLPPRIREVDVLEGDLLGQPIIINPSGSRQTDPIRDPTGLPAVEPLSLKEVFHTEQNAEGDGDDDTAMEDVVGQTPELPMREEVESREVEDLL